MRHVLSALVQNQPGVLAHVSGMLASRGFNIDSLAVGTTEDPQLSRMTFVVRGDDKTLDQARKQLEKIVTIVKVMDISQRSFVERDLVLVKISCTAGRRMELTSLTEIFRGKIVDVSQTAVIVEISGTENKIEAYIDMVRPFGILELARTGRVALVRASQPDKDAVDAASAGAPAEPPARAEIAVGEGL
ncbi:MAG: acetolactate synthase small subunit, partial [Planctomycetia bacterium]